MKLSGRSDTTLTDGRQRMWAVLSLPCALASGLIMLLYMLMTADELSTIIYGTERETQRWMLDLTFIAVEVLNMTFKLSPTPSSLISFCLMITRQAT